MISDTHSVLEESGRVIIVDQYALHIDAVVCVKPVAAKTLRSDLLKETRSEEAILAGLEM